VRDTQRPLPGGFQFLQSAEQLRRGVLQLQKKSEQPSLGVLQGSQTAQQASQGVLQGSQTAQQASLGVLQRLQTAKQEFRLHPEAQVANLPGNSEARREEPPDRHTGPRSGR
jgi:hypothetical protein